MLIGLENEISDILIYTLFLSFWVKNSHPVPSELRHDCLQDGEFLFSSVHISVES